MDAIAVGFNHNLVLINNLAPALEPTSSPLLAGIPEDPTSNDGTTVAQIVVDGSITDPDIDPAPEAIAVISVNNTNGLWQYRLDGGADWVNFSAITGQQVDLTTQARLLGPTDFIRFVPNTDWNGQAGITFRAWDRSQGTVGGTMDATYTGATNPFSTGSDTATITVSAVNDAPVLEFIPDQNATEGSLITFRAAASDVENDGLTFTLEGAPEGAVIDPTSGVFTWTPADGPASATFTIRVTDNGSPAECDSQQVTINVSNIAPTLSVSGEPTVYEFLAYSLTLGLVSDPGDDTVSAYQVHWGDGESTAWISGHPTGLVPTHIYSGTGERIITIDLMDEDGTYITAGGHALTVEVGTPSVAWTGPAAVDEGDIYSLHIAAITGGPPMTSYTIHWDDGAITTGSGSPVGQDFSHRYADEGVRNIRIDLTGAGRDYPAAAQLAVEVRNVHTFLKGDSHALLLVDNNGNGRIEGGDALTYRFVVTNTGPDVAQDVTMWIDLGAYARLVPGTARFYPDLGQPSFVSLDSARDSIGIFRNGSWVFNRTGTGIYSNEDTSARFGQPGDLPVVGDWNGDGLDEVGVYRNGQWILDFNGNEAYDGADGSRFFGGPSSLTGFNTSPDLPVVGDWNGDGNDNIGVFRDGQWLLDRNGNGAWDEGDFSWFFGQAGDRPVVGDWDGDGRPNIGVFNNGFWRLDLNGNGAWDSEDISLFFGQAGDGPVVGDWDGDGRDNIGVARDGTWILDRNGNNSWDGGDYSWTYGLTSDQPVVGVWRPSLSASQLPPVQVGDLQPGQSAMVELRLSIDPAVSADAIALAMTAQATGVDSGTGIPYGTIYSVLNLPAGAVPFGDYSVDLQAWASIVNQSDSGAVLQVHFSNQGSGQINHAYLLLDVPAGAALDAAASTAGWTTISASQLRLAVGDLAGFVSGEATLHLTWNPLTPPPLPLAIQSHIGSQWLDPLDDHVLAAGQELRFMALGHSERSGATLSYTISHGPTELAEQVYQLRQTLGLARYPDADGYRQGLWGGDEKWLYSPTQGAWYFLKPDGTLHQYNGEADKMAAPVIATLAPIIWQEPRLLYEAPAPRDPSDAGVTTVINGNLGEVYLHPSGTFTGIYQVTVNVDDGVEFSTESFLVGVVNNAPTLGPISDQTVPHDTAELRFSVTGGDPDGGQVLTYQISQNAYTRAYELDQTYGLEMHPNGYKEDAQPTLGAKKWMYNPGMGRWFYIRGNGELRELNYADPSQHGPFLARLPTLFYDGPSLLHEAAVPLDPNLVPVTTTISDTGEVAIDPPTGYRGLIEVTVTLTDGMASVSRGFLVNWL